ncbi:MAG: LLM class flavin-dependent oxidoreductase [Acidobacteriota bacterium]|nr:LLM class flavin-dependent oxidoreductase [Acidobacteriota bacterium]
MTQFWTLSFPLPGTPERTARRAEERGWDGLLFTDSQNFNGDCYSALAIASKATARIGLGTGVTNPYTRHAAVTASAIATIQVESQGRAVLGIGRGDSSLANLGLPPAPASTLESYLTQVQAYLRGEAVEHNGHRAPIRWIVERQVAKVPVDVAATGPRVTEIAGRLADMVTLAVGADTARLAAGVERARAARAASGGDAAGLGVGAYLNIAAHSDPSIARQAALGGVGTAAHFSGMAEGSLAQLSADDRRIVEAVTAAYELGRHGDSRGSHLEHLSDDFVARFAIVGSPAECADRLGVLLDHVPLDRVVIMTGSRGVDPTILDEVSAAVVEEVVAAVR